MAEVPIFPSGQLEPGSLLQARPDDDQTLQCFKLFFKVQYEKYHFQNYSQDQALLIELLDKVGIMDHELAIVFTQKPPVK